MEECNDDSDFLLNSDWDPINLASIFDRDFDDNTELWDNEMADFELLEVANKLERCSPIVEDISLDDYELYSAVEKIENE